MENGEFPLMAFAIYFFIFLRHRVTETSKMISKVFCKQMILRISRLQLTSIKGLNQDENLPLGADNSA